MNWQIFFEVAVGMSGFGLLSYRLGRRRGRARFNALNDLVDALATEVAGWRECNFLITIGDTPVIMATLDVLRDLHLKKKPAPQRITAKTPDGATYQALEPMRVMPRPIEGPGRIQIVISKMPDKPVVEFGLADLPLLKAVTEA